MKNIDSSTHVRGESIYVDDIPVREDTQYAIVFDSPKAHGSIKSLDFSEALQTEGVTRIFTAKDIPGENQIGGIIPDETLFAEDEVHFIGMPIALIVAKTEQIARAAKKKVKIEIEELPVITEAREAHAKKQFIIPSRTFNIGNTNTQWKKCEHIIEGTAKIGGQEHIYLEPQGSYVYPLENNNLKVHSSTQAPTHTQRAIAKVLGVPMHQIESDVIRIGGGFGGKEDQATPWACMAALAAYLLKKPVKLILHRLDDIRMTGKRHPYDFDFKIGMDKKYKILAYEVICYQNAGAAADLSPAIMERTLFHGGGSYFLPNAKITVHSCKTNLPPNTAFRGFGAPQAMFAIEAAITKAAYTLGIDRDIIQKQNLLKENNKFPYGQVAVRCNARKCWNKASKDFQVEKIKKKVQQFNKKNQHYKKGFSMFPLCFGISFTKTNLNQGRSLVHIYTDGSVGISTGVIEMGQGVNTKITQVAAQTLAINPSRIKIISTNTTRIANTSPTAASSGADLNGGATKMACENLLKRLIKMAAKELKQPVGRISIKKERVYIGNKRTDLTWEKLINISYENRINLSDHAHYATPQIHFDKTKEKGHPFAYHVYGTAATVVTVDCLRGIYEVDMVKIVHDFGTSMNLDIDVGQVEGALAQGIGLMTIEELLINPTGKIVYDSLSSYKVPDIYSVPKELEVHALKSAPAPLAILGSKAVGEPPLMYGIGTYFAILNAMRSFNPNFNLELWAPMTHQKTLLSLYENYGEQK